MQIEVIGVSGKVGSGKDYMGAHVLRPAGYARWAFAWPMKNEATGHGYSYEEVHFTKPPAVREFLQRRGTEEGWKKHGRDYWLKITHAWLRTMYEEHGLERVFFTDVRFPHEAEFVRSLGGKVVRMEHGAGRPYPLAGTPAAEHESETALDAYAGWDAVIVNSRATTPAHMQAALENAGVLPSRPRPRAAKPADDGQLALPV